MISISNYVSARRSQQRVGERDHGRAYLWTSSISMRQGSLADWCGGIACSNWVRLAHKGRQVGTPILVQRMVIARGVVEGILSP